MALARWQPFELMNQDMDDLVRRTFGDFGRSLLGSRGAAWAPALDAYVEGDEMHVRLELPGIDPDADVDIEVTNGVLHVSGERRREDTREGDGQGTGQGAGQGTGWFRREMSFGRFERHIGLPEGIDPEALHATYDAGILDITIPLPQKTKTKVKVEVGNQKQLK